jgi:AcrR family transcriptional regulator
MSTSVAVRMPTQSERTEATRGALIAAGRKLFGSRGYAAVGTEEVVAEAGVTRGALYHHFRDKRDLFRAVFVSQEETLLRDVEAKLPAEGAYARLSVALDATLDACTDPVVGRISFLDGPVVLGSEEWRTIVEGYTLGVLRFMLGEAMEAGELRPAPAEALAHLMLGALNEAGMVIAAGGDRDETGAALRALLEGLRA